MKFISILVEGFTELNFVEVVIKPHLEKRGIYTIANLVTSLRRESGEKKKGGAATYKNFRFDVYGFLNDSSLSLVTMMIDFYGLPKSFPGYTTFLQGVSCYEQVTHLETALRVDIAHSKFLPYFALHEFEAVLFADVEQVAAAFPDKKDRLAFDLAKIKQAFSSSEEINLDNPPAKRIKSLVPEYEKDSHGPLIASYIGLEKIRAECPHFAAWLNQLETVGTENDG